MWTHLIVVSLLAAEQVTKMLLTEDNDMIQAISPDRTDGPFDVSILPGRPSRNRAIPYAHCCEAPNEGLSIRAIAIK